MPRNAHPPATKEVWVPPWPIDAARPNGLSLPDPFPPPAEWNSREGPVGGAAQFSPCGRYRWWLLRRWRPDRAPVVFVGLNPSTADGAREDATVRRLRGLAAGWGHGQLMVLNLHARVGREPALLDRCREPVGGRNEAWLATALAWLRAEPSPREGPPPRVWLGWGQRGGRHGRDRRLLELLRCWGGDVVCVGTTRDGHPRHPLYTRANQAPLPFTECPSP